MASCHLLARLKAHPHALRRACGYALANKGTIRGRFRAARSSLDYEHGRLYGARTQPA